MAAETGEFFFPLSRASMSRERHLFAACCCRLLASTPSLFPLLRLSKAHEAKMCGETKEKRMLVTISDIKIESIFLFHMSQI